MGFFKLPQLWFGGASSTAPSIFSGMCTMGKKSQQSWKRVIKPWSEAERFTNVERLTTPITKQLWFATIFGVAYKLDDLTEVWYGPKFIGKAIICYSKAIKATARPSLGLICNF